MIEGSPEPSQGLACPACDAPMTVAALERQVHDTYVGYRGSEVRTPICSACGGQWLDRATLLRIVHMAQASAASTSSASRQDIARRPLAMDVKIVYLTCPICRAQMKRRNFGVFSGVVGHECDCGSFFERGDLADVVAFVRTGGLELTRPVPTARTPRETGRAPRPVLIERPPAIRREERGNFFVAFARWMLEGLARGCARALSRLERIGLIRARTSRWRR